MIIRKILLVFVVLLLAACANPQAEQKKRYFWPIGGHEQKIEYLKFYESDLDVKPAESFFAQTVLGVEKGARIFSSPRGIASNGTGSFFVADNGKRRVLICDLSKGEVRTLMDEDDEAFLFVTPMGVTLDQQGGGFVSDTSTGRIYRFSAAEQVVHEFGMGELNRPNGMVFDSQNRRLYVADTANHQIAVFSPTGQLLERLGRRGEGEGEFNFPLDVDLSPAGQLVVLDALNARVQVLNTDGRFIRQFGERGTALGSFQLPKSLAVNGFGHVYVSDSQAHKFVIFDLQGNHLLTIGGRSILVDGVVRPGGLDFPQGIAADNDGAIWIVDSLSRMVHQFQYLSEAYLRDHPIRPEEIYLNQPLQ